MREICVGLPGENACVVVVGVEIGGGGGGRRGREWRRR